MSQQLLDLLARHFGEISLPGGRQSRQSQEAKRLKLHADTCGVWFYRPCDCELKNSDAWTYQGSLFL